MVNIKMRQTSWNWREGDDGKYKDEIDELGLGERKIMVNIKTRQTSWNWREGDDSKY